MDSAVGWVHGMSQMRWQGQIFPLLFQPELISRGTPAEAADAVEWLQHWPFGLPWRGPAADHIKTSLFCPSDTRFPLNSKQHSHSNGLHALFKLPYEINGVSAKGPGTTSAAQ